MGNQSCCNKNNDPRYSPMNSWSDRKRCNFCSKEIKEDFVSDHFNTLDERECTGQEKCGYCQEITSDIYKHYRECSKLPDKSETTFRCKICLEEYSTIIKNRHKAGSNWCMDTLSKKKFKEYGMVGTVSWKTADERRVLACKHGKLMAMDFMQFINGEIDCPECQEEFGL